MTRAASLMYRVEQDVLRLEPLLPESALRQCAAEVAGGILDVPSLLLNSVMVPVRWRSRHQDSGSMSIAFAHRSFQEYFLARYILAVALEPSDATELLNSELPTPVLRFLHGLIAALPSEQQAIARSRLGKVTHQTLPEGRSATLEQPSLVASPRIAVREEGTGLYRKSTRP
jgi:hypothetical protein